MINLLVKISPTISYDRVINKFYRMPPLEIIDENLYFTHPSVDQNIIQQEKVIRAYLRHNLSDKLWNFSVRENADWYEKDENNRLVRIEDGPYFCQIGADFIAQLFITDSIKWPALEEIYCAYEKDAESWASSVTRYTNMQDFELSDNGIYLIGLDMALEQHHLVIVINGPYLTIYNTYGGTIAIFIITFLKEEWLQLFKAYNKMNCLQQEEIYKYLWGFDERVTFSPFSDSMMCGIESDNNNIKELTVYKLK